MLQGSKSQPTSKAEMVLVMIQEDFALFRSLNPAFLTPYALLPRGLHCPLVCFCRL